MISPVLSTRILSFLKNHYPDWVASSDLQQVILEKTSNTPQEAVKRLREMTNKGVLTIDVRNGLPFYRYNPDCMKFGAAKSSSAPVTPVKVKKEVFLTPCKFCHQTVPTSEVICCYCKQKYNLPKAPVHHICDQCFPKGHPEENET